MEKFKNIPDIYYINLKDRVDLREYTENNLNAIGIHNFKRVSNSKFSDENNWKSLIHNENLLTPQIESEVFLSILYIYAINQWLHESSEKYMIIMSDNVDYSYIEYFHDEWNWDYFMNNIPHDFDSILLGFEDKLEVLPCFLHPIRDSHGTGMTLLTRKYAEKLVKFHYVDEKYNFFQKISNRFWKNSNGLVPLHYFMNQCGKSYAIPMFPRNPSLTEDNYFDKNILMNNKKLYSMWWKTLRDTTTMEQFHLFHSDKDFYLNKKQLENNKFSVLENNINYNFLMY
jgi:hypothetical protein